VSSTRKKVRNKLYQAHKKGEKIAEKSERIHLANRHEIKVIGKRRTEMNSLPM
jgi:hypothetical protein